MKTKIATLLIVFGLFVASNAFAYPPFPAPKAVAESIANYVTNEIDYPEFAVKDKLESIVVVKLTVQEDGTFTVDAANCIDNRLKKHVIAAIHELNEKAEYYSQFAGMEVNLKLIFDLKLV